MFVTEFIFMDVDRDESEDKGLKRRLKLSWRRMIVWFKSYGINLVFMLLMMDVTKVLVGEHRPHFFETCRPDTAVNCTVGWVRLIGGVRFKILILGFILVSLSRPTSAQIQSHQLITCEMFRGASQVDMLQYQLMLLYLWFGIFNVVSQKFNLSSLCLLYKSFLHLSWAYAAWVASLTTVIIGLTWLVGSF